MKKFIFYYLLSLKQITVPNYCIWKIKKTKLYSACMLSLHALHMRQLLHAFSLSLPAAIPLMVFWNSSQMLSTTVMRQRVQAQHPSIFIHTYICICIIYLQLYGVSRRIRNITQIDLFATLLWCESVLAVFVIIAASHIKVSYLVLLLYCYLVASCALWWYFPCLPHY